MRNCHECGTKLRECLDGEQWCPKCQQYRRYASHGWARKVERHETWHFNKTEGGKDDSACGS